jgi:hypothetical protein
MLAQIRRNGPRSPCLQLSPLHVHGQLQVLPPGPGRYVTAALVVAAATAVLGTGPAAYAAAAAPQVSLPVAAIALGSDWSGQAGFGSTAPGFTGDLAGGAGRGAPAGGRPAGIERRV